MTKTVFLSYHLRNEELKQRGQGVPPLLLSSQRTSALDWKNILEEIRAVLER